MLSLAYPGASGLMTLAGIALLNTRTGSSWNSRMQSPRTCTHSFLGELAFMPYAFDSPMTTRRLTGLDLLSVRFPEVLPREDEGSDVVDDRRGDGVRAGAGRQDRGAKGGRGRGAEAERAGLAGPMNGKKVGPASISCRAPVSRPPSGSSRFITTASQASSCWCCAGLVGDRPSREPGGVDRPVVLQDLVEVPVQPVPVLADRLRIVGELGSGDGERGGEPRREQQQDRDEGRLIARETAHGQGFGVPAGASPVNGGVTP